MDIKHIGSRGIVFQFKDGDCIYMISSKNTLFLCDTHLGPKSMKHVKEYIITNKLNNKKIIIFNSHSHYDHIWSNCTFENEMIISHESCRKRMQEIGEYDIERYRNRFHNGEIELKLPNLTFENRLIFEDDEVEFIYAPGHTLDSAICIDRKDSIVYAGDLVEHYTHTNYYDLVAYLKTLNFIKELNTKTIISSHSGIVADKLIADNIYYINKLLLNIPIETKDDTFLKTHDCNIKKLLISKYENIAKEKLGKKFYYKSFKRDFWKLLNIKYEDLGFEHSHIFKTKFEELEKALKIYIESV